MNVTAAPAPLPTAAPSAGQQLAKAGVKAMFDPQVQYGRDQVEIGETYNNSVLQTSKDATELALCQAANVAYTNCPHWRGQLAALDATLSQVAAGCTGGPIGATLAATGRTAMYSDTVEYGLDQVEIGEAYAKGIRDNSSDPVQKQLATVALKGCENVSTWRAQVDLLSNLFDQVAPR